MKKLTGIIMSIVVAIGCYSFAACKPKIPNDDQTLEIFISNFGYGTDWLDDVIKLFKEESWVQEKYPNLNIPKPSKNSERGFPSERVMSGSTNSTDLFFGTATVFPQIEKEMSPNQGFFENLDELYKTTVPGEKVTFAEKMDPDFLTMNTFTHKNGDNGYYTVPWISGMQGLLYNQSQFQKLGIEVPLTTDQLRDETSVDIQSKGKTPFIFSSKDPYWSCTMFLIWWAQYEGLENYSYFYQGYVKDAAGDVEQSKDFIRQAGRLRSLEALESLISVNNSPSFIHENVNTLDFGRAQAQFLEGNGLMMPNGDWFENEMRTTQDEGVTDTFTFMKSPVLSAIREKCTAVDSDIELQTVIAAIDAGTYELPADAKDSDTVTGKQVIKVRNAATGKYEDKEQTFSVTKADYLKIKEARTTLLPVGNHTAYVPSYATAKGLAKDFLLFLATDKANESFIKTTRGASMPFRYNVEEKNPTLYGSLSQIQKDRLDLLKTGTYLMNENTFKMAYFGKLYRFSFTNNDIDIFFTTKNPKDYLSAKDIYDKEIAYWTDTRWNHALENAGFKS